MWAKPSKTQLKKIPELYKTEDIKSADKKIYLHFFIGGCDWYISEYDGKDTFFGFAILHGDTQMAEWGYISFNELKSVKLSFAEVDCDKHWTIRKASEVEKIAACSGGC